MAVLAVGAAACGERSSSADAARADSSAAGYAVGARRETTSVASAAASGAAQPRDSQPSRVMPAATPPVATPTVAPQATAAAAGDRTTGSAPAKPARDTTQPVLPATVPNVATRPALPDSTSASVAEAPVRVNEFLTYDRQSRTVSLQLIAGYNGLNGSLNYNGATNGRHGLYVPVGWRIHVAVTNRDSDLQHSAIVVLKVLPPPIEPSEPAFPAAALPQLEEGLHEDETGTIDFVADRAGQYMIACGVPGHAQAGMWLQLAVSNALKVPAYR
jgi:hypothetical protein